jgi:hypothetical protein
VLGQTAVLEVSHPVPTNQFLLPRINSEVQKVGRQEKLSPEVPLRLFKCRYGGTVIASIRWTQNGGNKIYEVQFPKRDQKKGRRPDG